MLVSIKKEALLMKKSMITLVAATTLFSVAAPVLANQYDDPSRAAVAARDEAARQVNKYDRPAVVKAENEKLLAFLISEKARVEKIGADWKEASQASAENSYNMGKELKGKLAELDAAISAKQAEINVAQAQKDAALAHYNEKVATHGESVAKLSYGKDLETAKAAESQIESATNAIAKLNEEKALVNNGSWGKAVADQYNTDARAQVKEVKEALDYIRDQIREVRAAGATVSASVSETSEMTKTDEASKTSEMTKATATGKKEAKAVEAVKTEKGNKKLPKTSAAK